jgi:hypothetical protein
MAKRDELHYLLPEAKLLQLLHSALCEGYIFAVIEDEPDPPGYDASEDYDPMDKGDGAERWVRKRAKHLRKSLRRYRHAQTVGESK